MTISDLKQAIKEFLENLKNGCNVEEQFQILYTNGTIVTIDSYTTVKPNLTNIKNIVWINSDTMTDKNYNNIVTHEELEILKDTTYINTHIDSKTLILNSLDEYYKNYFNK